jgi:hypothetical protein
VQFSLKYQTACQIKFQCHASTWVGWLVVLAVNFTHWCCTCVCVCVLSQVRDNAIVYGGGAAEISCALAVEEAANKVNRL